VPFVLPILAKRKSMNAGFKALLSFSSVLLLFAACSKSSGSNYTVDCSNINAKWAADVQPIINSSCATSSGCHAAGSTRGVLTTYANVYALRSNIRSQVASGAMPPGGSLTTDQKNKIICWIDSGAPNN
jgi:uncharacterized membrane protein